MSVAASALAVPDLHSVIDDDFLSKVAEILERLRAQSEMRGHPLLASLLAITKDEAEDDLRTRVTYLESGGLFGEADDGARHMAQRLSCGRRADDLDETHGPAELLSFMRA